MKKVVLLLGCGALVGCSSLSPVAIVGRQVSDEIIETSEWGLCEAASIGAIERYYRTTDERAARNQLCLMRALRKNPMYTGGSDGER
jgi:hypothetical protein